MTIKGNPPLVVGCYPWRIVQCDMEPMPILHGCFTLEAVAAKLTIDFGGRGYFVNSRVDFVELHKFQKGRVLKIIKK